MAWNPEGKGAWYEEGLVYCCLIVALIIDWIERQISKKDTDGFLDGF
jgi:hypothetical protein